MSRVSVDKERLEAIIKEKSECDCTYGDCPLVPDACATKTDGNWGFLCNKKGTIIAWLDVKDFPDDSHEDQKRKNRNGSKD